MQLHANWTGPLLCPLHLLLLHVSSVCTAGLNAAGEIASEAIADASTWDGPVQVQQSDRIPVSAFAEQLQYEPEQEPPEREALPAETATHTAFKTALHLSYQASPLTCTQLPFSESASVPAESHLAAESASVAKLLDGCSTWLWRFAMLHVGFCHGASIRSSCILLLSTCTYHADILSS